MFSITSVGEILWDVYPDKKRLGGAPFNFIYHIKKIIGNANFISSVGNDEYGIELLHILANNGFDTETIFIDDEHPTGKVNVTIDENKIPHFQISSKCSFDFLQLTDKAKQIINRSSDLIYFGTFTSRSETSRETIKTLLNNPTKKYFCDLNLRHNFYTKEFIELSLQTSNVLKINEDEFSKLCEIFHLNENQEAAVQEILERYKIDLLALTLGKDGAKLYSKNDFNYYKLESDEIVDTLGAGDAYSSILCLGYLYNFSLENINRLANEFALEICLINGALPTDDSIYDKYKIEFSEK